LASRDRWSKQGACRTATVFNGRTTVSETVVPVRDVHPLSHDQRQAEGSKRRELRLDSDQRRQDQADASKKLTNPDEDEQVLRRPGKPRHITERLVPQSLIVTADFAETVEAEEDSPQQCFAIPSIHDS
jgi:hypothetical protein